ncbi:ribonuclease R family protein [Novosphingopyxis sp.]|uniref:ribonuclease R family protein n=1 Tax=Novosphingopyxis sp. TaxID=2709690 RepID=UPI003B5C0D36
MTSRKAKGLPTPKQILEFIETSDAPAGKREIAKAFRLTAQEKIALKGRLKDMTDEGLIDLAPGRAFHKMGGLPKVAVLKVVEIDGKQPVGVPEHWEAQGAPVPKLRIIERGRNGALGIGDRVLARTESRGEGHIAHVMKKLARGSEQLLGVMEKDGDKFVLRSIDKKARRDTPISDVGDAKPGQLVVAEKQGVGAKTKARVSEVLGDPFAPKSFSLIAIAKYGIPDAFPDAAIADAQRVVDLPVTTEGREDLRHLPILAIDPRDARDHDDALWAAPDDDPANKGGFQAVVAIADVSYYVRPGGELDREARRRGNSVYFPDRVVPMLPHELSSDKCSLKAGEDRAAMACHLTIDAKGQVTGHRFTRATVRLSANIAYEDAQAIMDGVSPQTVSPEPVERPSTSSGVSDLKEALQNLWACWKLLFKAREARAPLDLDLPERQVHLDDEGKIASVTVRERLDAHRLVEDYMIAANVAAAKALEAKKSPVMYRAHLPPSREKLVALKDYLKTFDMEFALGQVVTPALFNRLIERVDDDEVLPQVMEQILRTQTQAYYGADKTGHFGLALASYAHFTSPIRRYADLLVHRALVDAYGLEMPAPKNSSIQRSTGLTEKDAGDLGHIAEVISRTERRAMEAERDTMDRYVAFYLSAHVDELVDARITGVLDFGFFATVEGLGGDGLVPVSTLGSEYFTYDEASRTLKGRDSGTVYKSGMKLKLKLIEANPVSGGLRFEVPDVEIPGKAPGRSVRHDKKGRPSSVPRTTKRPNSGRKAGGSKRGKKKR